MTKIFVVCTPYTPPSKDFVALEDVVKSGRLPNFGYQMQLSSRELEEKIRSREEIKQMLNALFGGFGPNREVGFDEREGLHLDALPRLRTSRLISEELLDFYTEQYARNGIHGTCRSYITVYRFSPKRSGR